MAVIRPEKAAKVAEIKELLTASKVHYSGWFLRFDRSSGYSISPQNARSWRQIWRCKKYNAAYCCKWSRHRRFRAVLEKNTAIAVAPEDPVAVAKLFAISQKKTKLWLSKLVYSTVKLSTKLQLKLWQNFRRKKSSLQKCWAAWMLQSAVLSMYCKVLSATLFMHSRLFVSKKSPHKQCV